MKVDKTGEVCRTCKGERKLYRILVRKTEGKRPFGRAGRKRENNIKIELQEIEWDACAWLNWFRIQTSSALLQKR